MKIDPTESFTHLPRAPIVEAVIGIVTRAEVAWEEQTVSEKLRAELPDYPNLRPQLEFQTEVNFNPGKPPEARQRDLGWKGIRVQSADGLHIAQFNRDGFLFSRLQPYENWDQLRDEALRLWQIYSRLAQPTEAQRLGLRFINRIVLPVQELDFEKYLKQHPVPPTGLDPLFVGFLHVDTLAIPGYAYTVNVIRTMQTPSDLQTAGLALILDIDVVTTQPFQLSQNVLESRLAEMRWLKNKVFFSSITEHALELFQ
ncbi:conserved hypothetical protein [Verrucomicrobia bacterium]|nr:conserved hypothetical protein [Verrucomicrobiota bacterium]